MKIFKKISGLLVIVFGIFLFGFYVKDIEAATSVKVNQESTKLTFKDYGITNSWKNTAWTRIKHIDGKLAYCIQTRRIVSDSLKYIRYDFEDTTKSKVAGQIIYLVEKDAAKFKSATERYMFLDAALNTYFASEGYKTSVKYTDSNGYINKVVSDAKSYVNNMKATLSNPSLTSNVGYSKLSSGGVVSTKISLSGLVKDFNGNVPVYTIAATATNGGTAVICTGASGTGCSSSKQVKNDSDNVYSFYVKVTGYDVEKGSYVTIRVSTGKITYNYPFAVRYVAEEDGDANGSKQILVVADNGTGSDYATASRGFRISAIPKEGVSHDITLYKVNDDGDNLKGAKFTLNGGKFWNNVAGKESSDGVFEWNTSYLLSADATDEFYGTELTITEDSAPDGYIKMDAYTFKVDASGSACYDSEGKEVNSSYCDESKYVPACKEGFTYNSLEKRCEKQSLEYVEKISENTSQVSLDDYLENGYYADLYTFNKDTGKYLMTNPSVIKDLDDTGINGLVNKFICSSVDVENDNICKSILYKVSSVVQGEEDGKYLINVLEYSSELPAPELADVICSFNGTKVESSCDDLIKDYTFVSSYGGNISINMHNARNSVKISKQTILGDKSSEVSGAKLKICTEKEYKADGKKCKAALTVDGLEMSWISSSIPVEWRGLSVGNYYIIETTPPTGYVLVDAVTQFSIDEKGVVKTGKTVVKDNVIIINNQLNDLSISKTDIATGKELPGAELSICIAIKNKDGKYEMPLAIDGECLVTNLYDGSVASWVSTDKPKEIKGLPSGSYYLVEKIAPEGYTTAESILFTVKDDGTITDKDGKEIKDKKIVMRDKPIEDVKTGQLPMIIVAIILMASIGAIVYYGMKNNDDDNSGNTNNKLRGRKLHSV